MSLGKFKTGDDISLYEDNFTLFFYRHVPAKLCTLFQSTRHLMAPNGAIHTTTRGARTNAIKSSQEIWVCHSNMGVFENELKYAKEVIYCIVRWRQR